MLRRNPLPDQETIKSLLRYEGETGYLYWTERPLTFHGTAPGEVRRVISWNQRFAGKLALNSTKGNGYLGGKLLCQSVRSSRVIWKLVFGVDPVEVDHINGNRRDNRIENLRSVSPEENHRNQKLHCTNTSGVSGVFFVKSTRRWSARISVNNVKRSLGYFETREEAIVARRQAEKLHDYHVNHGQPTAARLAAI
jgi:hypothetical protein